MKRFLAVFFCVFVCFQSFCNAQDINFIYIHGANDNNYKKKQEFSASVKKVHPYIKKVFEKDPLSKKYFLQNGNYTIDPNPIAFYWGDRSKEDLNLMMDWLDITKFFSPKIAQSVRSTLAYTLHDAIWVQKYNNMRPIVRNLHSMINYSVDQNEDKFVLIGHSAGSFITFEYLLYKLPMIDPVEFLARRGVDRKQLREYRKIYSEDTCVDALLESGLAEYLRDGSFIVANKDKMTENYKTLGMIAQKECVRDDSLRGVILFGTPLTLFYSGFNVADSRLLMHLSKYVIEHDMFFVSVNYAEDPLGFPISSNDNYDLIATFKDRYGYALTPNNGFIYDKSNVRCNKFVSNAHTAYWKTPDLFSKTIIEAYNEGYSSYYVNAIKKKTTDTPGEVSDEQLLRESNVMYSPKPVRKLRVRVR